MLAQPLLPHILGVIPGFLEPHSKLPSEFDARAGPTDHRVSAYTGLYYMRAAGHTQPLNLNTTKHSAPQHTGHICDGHKGWATAGLVSPAAGSVLDSHGPGTGSNVPSVNRKVSH